MELKDWLQLFTSWVAIGVTVWVELRKNHKPDEKPKRKKRRRK